MQAWRPIGSSRYCQTFSIGGLMVYWPSTCTAVLHNLGMPARPARLTGLLGSPPRVTAGGHAHALARLAGNRRPSQIIQSNRKGVPPPAARRGGSVRPIADKLAGG